MEGKKLLVVHAGTHKTATTYIQNRLWLNRDKLLDGKTYLLAPETRKHGRYHRFATNIAAKKNNVIRQELLAIPDNVENVIVSDERLAGVLIRQNLLEGFLKAVGRAGFRLRVVLFLRDQPDYINSLYVQEIKRFYHSETMKKYIKRCMRKRSDRFDYNEMFSGLIENPLVDVQFLPFGSGYGDPFVRLMDAQGWECSSDWNPANSQTVNDQVGTKGVWLAQRVGMKLIELGAKRSRIKGQSRFIRIHSEKRDWSLDRYYGINKIWIKNIRKHYEISNNIFSQRIWGCQRVEKFPPYERELNVFKLSKLEMKLQDEMNNLVDEVVESVKREKPEAFESSE